LRILKLRHVLEYPLSEEKDGKKGDDDGNGEDLAFEDGVCDVRITAFRRRS
jgi:hypothetical protein